MSTPNAAALALLALVFAAGPLPGQTTGRIVPAVATKAGNLSTSLPFSGVPIRMQLLADRSEIAKGSALLKTLIFRPGANVVTQLPARTLTVDLKIGESTLSVHQMSRDFAKNPSFPMTRVLQGNFNLPAQNLSGSVGPWNIRFPFSAPVLYVAARGNLLIDLTIATSSSNAFYVTDAVSFGRLGSAQLLGSRGRFPKTDNCNIIADTSRLYPGGEARVRLLGLRNAYPTLLIFGFSKTQYGPLQLPFDLGAIGATGSRLYPSLDFVNPIALQSGTTGYEGHFQVPVPSSVVGAFSFYAQGLFLIPRANPAGIVTSGAIDLFVPLGISRATTRVLYAKSATATQGDDPIKGQYLSFPMLLEGSFQ